MTDTPMSPAEIQNAAQQFSSFLMKLQAFPRLVENVGSLLQGQSEQQARLASLREEETNTRARLDALAQSINDAGERARQAYAVAMADQGRELAALQGQVADLSAAASNLRQEVAGLQAKRDELTASLSTVAQALKA